MQGIKRYIGDRIYLRWLFLPSHWLFQGLLGADWTERVFKITFSLVCTGLLFVPLRLVLKFTAVQAVLFAFLAAHTLNWMVNCNVIGNLKHRARLGKTEKGRIFDYLEELSQRIADEPSVQCAAVFGSLTRGELHEYSDVDVSLIRQKGAIQGVRALWFLTREIRKANKQGIPLEVYLGDSLDYWEKRYKASELPVVLSDRDGVIKQSYDRTLSLEDARALDLQNRIMNNDSTE